MNRIVDFSRLLVRRVLQNCFLFPFLRHYCSEFAVVGLEKLEGLSGPCVFVSNHSSHADVAIILAALPSRHRDKLAIAAAAEYFYTKKTLGAIVTLMLNTFAFEREHPRSGMLKARRVLEGGQSLLIFPQGTRSNPASCVGFKRGFASLACKLGLPIVPICIEGSFEMLPKGSNWPRKTDVKITFGEPIYAKQSESVSQLAHEVEDRVQRLSIVA